MPLITKVLKPEEFNAVTLAQITGEISYRPFGTLSDEAKTLMVDRQQALLDALVARGILAVE